MIAGLTQKNMPETTEENMMVPMIGSGELVDLNEMRKSLKEMPDKDLTEWYVKYYKMMNEAISMIRGELIGRMVKNGSTVAHAHNGQRVKMKTPPKRTADREILLAVQEKIKKEFDMEIKLFKVKEEITPVMAGVKEARELSMDIAMAIAPGIQEEPGYASLEILGADKERAAKAFEDTTE